MVISYKMIDGSHIDVPVQERQKLNDLTAALFSPWVHAYDGDDKRIILRSSNIVSITIKGDGDDS